MPDDPNEPSDNKVDEAKTDEALPEELDEASLTDELNQLQSQIGHLVEDLSIEDIARIEDVYYLWLCWGDFHIYITYPEIPIQLPPKKIKPSYDSKTGEAEHVYPIADYGNRFSTSPGSELAASSRTSGKLLNTVEKIMALALKRAQKVLAEQGEEGEGGAEPEVRVAFLGVDVAQRRAYQLCLDSKANVVVTNFEPGEWGERFFKTFEELYDRGYLPTTQHYKF